MEIETLETKEMLFMENKTIQSVYPPESLYGFTYFSYMVPPFKPQRMLMLGYGAGTIPSLTQKIWGDDIEIVGVDKDLSNSRYVPKIDGFFEKTHLTLIEKDAQDYVSQYDIDEGQFDYVAVDLFNGDKPASIVSDKDFANKLSKMCSLRIAINLYYENLPMAKEYYKYFQHEMTKQINRNFVLFYKVKTALNQKI